MSKITLTISNIDLRPTPDRTQCATCEWSFLGLFAVLLALFTIPHELWADEVQAWLIARDNNSLFSLIHSLHYEGHPVLWYLILYIPAHLLRSSVSMMVLNYLFSVAEAWLILSARKLWLPFRVLLVFSFYLFYCFAEIARSYMLATLLLTAAARCLLGERKHPWLAVLFLVMACNTHILAIPIAISIGFWGFVLVRIKGWQDVDRLLHDAKLWAITLLLGVGIALAYITVRPAPADMIATGVVYLPAEHHSFAYNFLLSEGRSWEALFPVSINHLPNAMKGLIHPHYYLSLPACGFSFAVFLLVTGSLRTNYARYFFLLCSVLEWITFAVTVTDPWMIRYLGFIFVVFFISLMIDAYAPLHKTARSRFAQAAATNIILTILTFQALTGVLSTLWYSTHHYSRAANVAYWLKSQRLDKNPLILDGYDSLAVMGYLERPSAYITSCQCIGSYIVWNNKYDDNRDPTLQDIDIARSNNRLPVILIRTNNGLFQEQAQKLGLIELQSFVDTHGAFTIYEQKNP